MIRVEVKNGVTEMAIKDTPEQIALAERLLRGATFKRVGIDEIRVTIPNHDKFTERQIRRQLNAIGIMPW